MLSLPNYTEGAIFNINEEDGQGLSTALVSQRTTSLPV
jgi:hypothetical protein